METTPVDVPNAGTAVGPTHWIALSLAAVAGVIHLYLYATDDRLPFLFAGAGFVGAIGLFFLLEGYRPPLHPVGVPFTVAQIVGYLLFPMGSVWLGVFDKAVQVALVIALGYLFVTADRESSKSRRRRSAPSRTSRSTGSARRCPGRR